MLTKNVTTTNNDDTGTCSDEIAKPETEVQTSENGEQQPPQKRKRLSNREYKKLMKGQNKVNLSYTNK